jgi:hypothetical protein
MMTSLDVMKVFATKLPTGAGELPCRKCGRNLKGGDFALARVGAIGYACITCGWYRLEDLVTGRGNGLGKIGEAFIAAARGIRAVNEWEAKQLQSMGLVTRKNRLVWTDVGDALRAQLLRRAA